MHKYYWKQAEPNRVQPCWGNWHLQHTHTHTQRDTWKSQSWATRAAAGAAGAVAGGAAPSSTWASVQLVEHRLMHIALTEQILWLRALQANQKTRKIQRKSETFGQQKDCQIKMKIKIKIKIKRKRGEATAAAQLGSARNWLLIAMAARYHREPAGSAWMGGCGAMANANGRRLNGHLAAHQSRLAGKQDAALLNEPQNCAATPKKKRRRRVESKAAKWAEICYLLYIAWHIHAMLTTLVLGIARNRLTGTHTHTSLRFGTILKALSHYTQFLSFSHSFFLSLPVALSLSLSFWLC